LGLWLGLKYEREWLVFLPLLHLELSLTLARLGSFLQIRSEETETRRRRTRSRSCSSPVVHSFFETPSLTSDYFSLIFVVATTLISNDSPNSLGNPSPPRPLPPQLRFNPKSNELCLLSSLSLSIRNAAYHPTLASFILLCPLFVSDHLVLADSRRRREEEVSEPTLLRRAARANSSSEMRTARSIIQIHE